LLRRKVARLAAAFPSGQATGIEEWLVDLANARGARVIARPVSTPWPNGVPGPERLTDEELVVALCQPHCLDHPQMLRPAAQLLSRGQLDATRLLLLARRERVEIVLAELARQALCVEPRHPLWRQLFEAFGSAPVPRQPLLHWTRLAEPIPVRGRGRPAGWRLVQ
jgi:hypothetical protein